MFSVEASVPVMTGLAAEVGGEGEGEGEGRQPWHSWWGAKPGTAVFTTARSQSSQACTARVGSDSGFLVLEVYSWG